MVNARFNLHTVINEQLKLQSTVDIGYLNSNRQSRLSSKNVVFVNKKELIRRMFFLIFLLHRRDVD